MVKAEGRTKIAIPRLPVAAIDMLNGPMDMRIEPLQIASVVDDRGVYRRDCFALNCSILRRAYRMHSPIYQPVNVKYPNLSKACTNPPIYLIDNFLASEKCEYLMKQVEGFLEPAPVVGAGNIEISTARTSSTCSLRKEDVPTLMNDVSSLLDDKPIEHCELPQIGRYLPTQEYKAHYDAFDLDTAEGRQFLSHGGQRVATVLIYLNSVSEGGRTEFPKLNMGFQPRQGSAVVFFPATLDGDIDSQTLHGKP
jgi:prolyl 4-hydroxylase